MLVLMLLLMLMLMLMLMLCFEVEREQTSVLGNCTLSFSVLLNLTFAAAAKSISAKKLRIGNTHFEMRLQEPELGKGRLSLKFGHM